MRRKLLLRIEIDRGSKKAGNNLIVLHPKRHSVEEYACREQP